MVAAAAADAIQRPVRNRAHREEVIVISDDDTSDDDESSYASSESGSESESEDQPGAKRRKTEETVVNAVFTSDKPNAALDVLAPEDSDTACVVCMTNLRKMIVLPCFHMRTCIGCTLKLQERNDVCPCCRGTIESVKCVY